MPPPVFLTVTESAIVTALGDFISAFTTLEAIQGQENRVAEPAQADFAIMWPTLRERLETNSTSYSDITFTGSIAGNTLTVSGLTTNRTPAPAGYVTMLQPNQEVFGVGVAAGTQIVSQLTGPTGGNGTYAISGAPQTVAAELMAAGLISTMAPVKASIQIDVHGPNSTDNTQILVALFRDEIACDFFDQESIEIQPLYIDHGKRVPFVNAENQYEDRWVLEAKIQANPVVMTPGQFASSLTAGLVEIYSTYPP